MTIKRLTRRTVFRTKLFKLCRDLLEVDGKRMIRDILYHPGAVAMVPLLDRHRVILVKQFRYAANSELWEIPAGSLERHELVLACAKRELEEEIGYRARRWRKLIRFYAAPGVSTEIMHIYLATGLVKTRQRLERDEVLTVHIVALSRALRMIRTGQIQDAKSIIGLLLARNAIK